MSWGRRRRAEGVRERRVRMERRRGRLWVFAAGVGESARTRDALDCAERDDCGQFVRSFVRTRGGRGRARTSKISGPTRFLLGLFVLVISQCPAPISALNHTGVFFTAWNAVTPGHICRGRKLSMSLASFSHVPPPLKTFDFGTCARRWRPAGSSATKRGTWAGPGQETQPAPSRPTDGAGTRSDR